jgi:hypothetical protein
MIGIMEDIYMEVQIIYQVNYKEDKLWQ